MSKISRPEYINVGIKIYLEQGKPALLDYLRKIEPTIPTESYGHKIFFGVFCPSCGHNFAHSAENAGKVTGGVSGMAAGAYLGAQVGIAGGPLGAIAGTIPGAILGGLFGKHFGNNFDNPQCDKCNNTFEMPKNAKIIEEAKPIKSEQNILDKANIIIIYSKQDKQNREALRKKFDEIRERLEKKL